MRVLALPCFLGYPPVPSSYPGRRSFLIAPWTLESIFSSSSYSALPQTLRSSWANSDVPSLLGHTVGTRTPRTSCSNGSFLTWGSLWGPLSQSILLRVNCSPRVGTPKAQGWPRGGCFREKGYTEAREWCVPCTHARSPTMCARVVGKKGRGMGWGQRPSLPAQSYCGPESRDPQGPKFKLGLPDGPEGMFFKVRG